MIRFTTSKEFVCVCVCVCGDALVIMRQGNNVKMKVKKIKDPISW
jgi:hypothetical protein